MIEYGGGVGARECQRGVGANPHRRVRRVRRRMSRWYLGGQERQTARFAL